MGDNLPSESHRLDGEEEVKSQNEPDKRTGSTQTGGVPNQNDSKLRNLHILDGQLDYDVRYGGETTRQKSASPQPLVKIKMVYPSKAFGEDNTEFKKRHESMQADADEHYKLLVDMQVTDASFDSLLLSNHKRKVKVEKILAESRNWQRFVREIAQSSEH